jgi:hypothetical protein
MFRHLSLQEKIELLLGTRTSGGALPLPEAFGAALSYLHDKGSSADDVLKKVIRNKRQVEFREIRILEVCDDWDSFCTTILDVLESGKFLAREDNSWSLGDAAYPGKELTIMRVRGENGEDRRVRVTFFGEQYRLERNQVEGFKGDIEALAARIPELGYLTPGTGETVSQYLLACSQLLRETLAGNLLRETPLPELPSDERRKRRNKGVAGWYRRWVRTAGWHTQIEAWLAWNEAFPDRKYHDASVCPTRNAAMELVMKGVLEKREVEVLRDNARTEYRYIGGSVLSGD